MKTCFKCNSILPLSEFYRHPMMADGHVNKCKSCNKADVIGNRLRKVSYYREYDRVRSKTPERKLIFAEKNRRMNARPHFTAAHNAVSRAVKSGRLVRPLSCERCPSTGLIQAHHDDHSRYLDVMWLCPICHAQRHVELAKAAALAA